MCWLAEKRKHLENTDGGVSVWLLTEEARKTVSERPKSSGSAE